jgi:hypothetical protein
MHLSEASVELSDDSRLHLSLGHLNSLVRDLVAEILELSHHHLGAMAITKGDSPRNVEMLKSKQKSRPTH